MKPNFYRTSSHRESDRPLVNARHAVPGLRSGVLGLLVLSGLFLSGCASTELTRVKPWQRATLADYSMRPDRDPLNTAMAEHVYFSRETASGGRGVGGSGCGCN